MLTGSIIITLSWDVPWPGRIGSVCGVPPPGRSSSRCRWPLILVADGFSDPW